MDNLLPYIGNWTRIHLGHGPDFRGLTRIFRSTPQVRYDFNSLGFRCDEFRPAAKKKIFACGCSYTFGMGLNVEQTWPAQFAAHYTTHCNLLPSDVCLMNFSHGNGSNEYIARTLMAQSATSRPDIIIAHFSHLNRLEYYLNGRDQQVFANYATSVGTFAMGPSLLRDRWFTRWKQCRHFAKPMRRLIKRMYRWNDAYYRHVHSRENSIARTLYNILSIQYYCETNRVPYLFTCVDHKDLTEDFLSRQPALGQLSGLINRKRFLSVGLLDKDIYQPISPTIRYPNAQTHAAFADRLWESFLACGESAS